MTSTKHCPELCRLIGPPYLVAWASIRSGAGVNTAELVDGELSNHGEALDRWLLYAWQTTSLPIGGRPRLWWSTKNRR